MRHSLNCILYTFMLTCFCRRNFRMRFSGDRAHAPLEKMQRFLDWLYNNATLNKKPFVLCSAFYLILMKGE